MNNSALSVTYLQTIVPYIIAVLAEIIKPMPKAANKIKKFIDGERINIIEQKVVSDAKLIDQYFELLLGKGFNVTVLIFINEINISGVTLNNLLYLSWHLFK